MTTNTDNTNRRPAAGDHVRITATDGSGARRNRDALIGQTGRIAENDGLFGRYHEDGDVRDRDGGYLIELDEGQPGYVGAIGRTTSVHIPAGGFELIA